jgi:predicted nucleotidyltransferase
MKFGLEDRHFQLIQTILIEPLKAKGAKVWIFGSRARGKHHRFSDLDVLFESGSTPIETGEIGAINEALEDSALPIKVDIVDIRFLAESYRHSALSDRVEV